MDVQEASVFIVHLWPANGPDEPFRATVQRAGTDESAWFTQADALVRFLMQQARPTPTGAEVPRDLQRGETS